MNLFLLYRIHVSVNIVIHFFYIRIADVSYIIKVAGGNMNLAL